jgi:hypothetical protein
MTTYGVFSFCVCMCVIKKESRKKNWEEREKWTEERVISNDSWENLLLHVPNGNTYFKTKKYAVIPNGSLVCRTLTC